MTNRTNPSLSPLVAVTLLLVLLAACATPTPEAAPFRSDRFNLEVALPTGWQAAEGPALLARPFSGLVAFNSWGEAGYWAAEVKTQQGGSTYGPQGILGQVPDGGAYIALIHFAGGPLVSWEDYGPEYERGDLGTLWQAHDCREAGGATWVDFSKWGRRLRLEVYCGAGATDATVAEVNELLASWRFDRVPAGDAGWATLQARELLPDSAHPEKFPLLTNEPVEGEPMQSYAAGPVVAYLTRADIQVGTVVVTFVLDWNGREDGEISAECSSERCHWWRFEARSSGEVVLIEEGGGALPLGEPVDAPAPTAVPIDACVKEDGVVFTVPVGPNGVQYGAEQTGPMALAVAPDGTFWIADTQGNRLLHYDPHGVLLNQIDLNGHGIGVADVEAIGSDVNALMVGYGEKVLRFTADGNLLATYDIPEGLGPESGLTGLAVGDQGEILLEFMMGAEVAQLVDARGVVEPAPLSGYTHEGKLYKARQSGSWTSAGTIVAGSARIEVTVPNLLAGLRILGFAPAGNLYAVVDEMVSTPTVWVDQTVHLYGPAGELLGMARVPVAERYTYVQNGLAVGPDGCVYALLTRPDQVEVIRLGFSTELESILPTPVR
ncbi:MAG: hypothetical protein M8467_10200 [Anaerolineae bacterium]|nr:hypothetical protein [Anaerolineae bacterium]